MKNILKDKSILDKFIVAFMSFALSISLALKMSFDLPPCFYCLLAQCSLGLALGLEIFSYRRTALVFVTLALLASFGGLMVNFFLERGINTCVNPNAVIKSCTFSPTLFGLEFKLTSFLGLGFLFLLKVAQGWLLNNPNENANHP